MRGRHITLVDVVEVIDPIPGGELISEAEELEGLITLATCHPQFSNAERMIAHAMEVEATSKTARQRPTVLEEN